MQVQVFILSTDASTKSNIVFILSTDASTKSNISIHIKHRCKYKK